MTTIRMAAQTSSGSIHGVSRWRKSSSTAGAVSRFSLMLGSAVAKFWFALTLSRLAATMR